MNSQNKNEMLDQNKMVELNDEVLEQVVGGTGEHGGRHNHNWHPRREGGDWGNHHGHDRHGHRWERHPHHLLGRLLGHR